MRDQQVIPLMLGSSGSGWATREMGTMFTMGGVSYLPWLAGSLEERLGEGYWLSFNQRLPISYKLRDCLYRLLSGPLYPNAPSALFCAFPRPASPTSSTYPVGCPSPT